MKISVIIPVYNAEKFLPACLESLLIQTLTDFEVIAVDDCSTDSSCAILESFLPRFNGRLKIISLPKNTGNPSVPRNEGLSFSRGEYVYFPDDDDLLIDTALETLYNFAENYRADAVYMEQGFICDEEGFSKNLTTVAWTPPEFMIGKVNLETENLADRLKIFLSKGYSVTPWTKFLRRDFLIAEKITFPRVKILEDVLWTFKVLCTAKNFLRIPNRLYVYRSVKNSWSRIEREPADKIKFWLDPLINGLEYLDAFMDENIFFARNPNYRFEVTNFFVKMQLAEILDATEPAQLYEIVRREFDGKHASLIASLFVFMNYYRNKNRG